MLVHMVPWHQSMAAIAAGDSDRYLHQFAGAVRRYGGHVIISFAPEADGRWYPWGWHHADPGPVGGGLAACGDGVPPVGRDQRDLAMGHERG